MSEPRLPSHADNPEPGIPPEAGKGARLDRSGAVHGSGAGAGGGNPGEDYDAEAGGDEALNVPPSEQS